MREREEGKRQHRAYVSARLVSPEALTENGSLVAPFDGIHGWYLKNDTDRPVVVRLTLAGFYEVIPNQLPN